MAFDDPFKPRPFPSSYVVRVEEDEYRWVIHRHRDDSGWVDILRSPQAFDSWSKANDEGARALLDLVRAGDL